MRLTYDRAISTLLTTATVVCALILVRRELQPEVALATRDGPPEYVADWRTIPWAQTFGNPVGAVQLVIFTDFECPFCRRFHEQTLPRILNAFPDSVGWSVVHFPLSMHRFARPAAVAFECARGDLSRQQRIVDLLYAKQDSLGLKAWAGFAREAGIQDTLSFDSCVREPRDLSRLDLGEAAAKRLGVQGTPGVMVNGWLFPAPPADSILIGLTRLMLANNNQLPDVTAPRR